MLLAFGLFMSGGGCLSGGGFVCDGNFLSYGCCHGSSYQR
jgi:hypothetical protein